ncbi:hypothetical protein XENTR_v10024858 [Xenopus tropicalis]|nr:hypothetical protein XENTR_v10024858 [Xenopus tropicalis]
MLGSSLSALSATSIATGLSPAAPGTSMPPLSCSPVPEVMAPASCSSQASVPQLPAGTPAWIPRADAPTQPGNGNMPARSAVGQVGDTLFFIPR